MTEPPTIDDRSQEALLTELTNLAEQYVDGWKSSSTDTATVLLRIASEFGAETIQQLNRLPQKHRAAFLDSLGFQRRPPQAARLPLSVEVSTDLDRNVSVPGGTQAIATTSDAETVLFELPQGAGFEATPASLTESYAVDPSTDRIVRHHTLIDGESQQLFAGENHQQHALYLGDDSLLTLDPGSVIEVEFSGSLTPEALADGVCWEYHGVDSDGTEGWHTLPVADRPERIDGAGDELSSHRVDQLSTDSIAELSTGSVASTAPEQPTNGVYSASLRLPAEPTSTAIGGIESRWIRCRLESPQPACFATHIESIRARVVGATESEPITPDAGFADDVPLTLDTDDTVRPFGRQPRPSSTVYLTAHEALSKPGGLVTLSFQPPAGGRSSDPEPASGDPVADESDDIPTGVDFGILSGPPEISWEYWNGTGWAGLTLRSDDTDRLRTAGELQFVVPDDIEKTAVSGHEARWIRGRLVSGSYGHPVGVTNDTSGIEPSNPPQYGGISLHYEQPDSSFAETVIENNGVVEPAPESAEQYRPFRRLSEDSQMIYLGFDDALRDGPIPILWPLAESNYPQAFDPGVQWEYCTDPATDSWSSLSVEDGTDGLTERGIVSLRFPESTMEHERFGTRCHWIRAVVTEDTFSSPDPVDDRPTRSESTDTEPPVVSGLYPNTQWADNTRTVEDELLGSSDGSAGQTFDCAHGPLIDCEVWVDEADSLSAAERAALRESDSDRVEAVIDDNGDCTEFWVRWTTVDEFLDVGGESRSYRCDRLAGTIRFGDGEAGKIPPRGQDTIRATYTTGGGTAGNVPAGAITDLKTPISLVESVDNPLPADGGAGSESTAAVASRAASEIKTRGRAVTPADFEAVAATTVRKLATVDCRPHLGPDGQRQPGEITLLIVPDTDRERPQPSMALEQRVHRVVSEAAPATLTAGESRITVRGPNYAAVSVDVTIRTTGVASFSVLKAEIESALAAYLDPLTGGPDATGWAFGELPTAASLQSVLASVADVDTVVELSATVQCADDTLRLTHGPSIPTLPSDGLVCNGSHEITVRVGDQQ